MPSWSKRGLDHLWHGRLSAALAWLGEHRAAMRDAQALDDLVRYLEERAAYVPDYALRHGHGLLIASTSVEKMNDTTVAYRCKGKGMSWHDGVHALATLKAQQLNSGWQRVQGLVLDMAV